MKQQFFILLFIYYVITLSAQDIIFAASEPDYPPFCIVDKNGEADGFSVDLFKASAAIMGLKVEFKVDNWAIIKEELAKGKIDALPLVGRSIERDKFYDFTFPYHTLHGAIFVRKGNNSIKILSDLKNKDVLVMKGDNSEEYVYRDNISSHIFSTNSYKNAFKLLESGKYDAVIAQKLMGLQLLDSLDINTITPLNIELTGFSQDFSFAVTEGNKALLEKLNEGLAIIIANGTYDKIDKKWFTPEMQLKVSFGEVLKTAIYILIPLLILIALAAIIILRSEVKRQTKFLQKEMVVREKAEKEVKLQLEEKSTILRESHHRIKNNFATIGGLLATQAMSLENPEAITALNNAVGRVNSMAILYEKMLYEDNYLSSSVKGYLNSLIDDIVSLFPNTSSISVEKQISELSLNPKVLFPIGIILNELLTNIMKYAFVGKESGEIKINLKVENKYITLTIQDNGVGLPVNFDIKNQKGFGIDLIRMLTEQLNGEFLMKNFNGTRSILKIPI